MEWKGIFFLYFRCRKITAPWECLSVSHWVSMCPNVSYVPFRSFQICDRKQRWPGSRAFEKWKDGPRTWGCSFTSTGTIVRDLRNLIVLTCVDVWFRARHLPALLTTGCRFRQVAVFCEVLFFKDMLPTVVPVSQIFSIIYFVLLPPSLTELRWWSLALRKSSLVCFRFPLFVSHHAAPVCFSVKHKAHHSWQFTWSLQQLGTLCTLALSWFTHETCDACADCAAPFGEKRFAW